MKVEIHSYRFAAEILQHTDHANAWQEIHEVMANAPLFIYPGKSKKNKSLDVVQQLMNVYFDRRFAVDLNWDFHPLATNIEKSGLKADFRKSFGNLVVQAEVQFGNMSRWYSDVFKFQTAYSQRLINIGLCVVPMNELAKRIDSNVANYERTLKELPSAELSITLPIVLAGLTPDANTPVIDVSKCKFTQKQITGKGATENRWRIINAYMNGIPMSEVGPESDIGPMAIGAEEEGDDTEDSEE